ncbi:MAG: indole-3-glycerol-phosphate synthase, partial [Deltaproteobacteria bacterium]|nr:indole-3-glycerol-phosphate synthase [Deltaproteobacteria bacterium]
MRLERFYRAKQAEVAALRERAERGDLPAPYAGQRPDFAGALLRMAPGAPLAVVAEYKRSSPSAGLICDALTVEEAVRQYARNGASCLSVLTEEIWFGGNLEMLRRASAPS